MRRVRRGVPVAFLTFVAVLTACSESQQVVLVTPETTTSFPTYEVGRMQDLVETARADRLAGLEYAAVQFERAVKYAAAVGETEKRLRSSASAPSSGTGPAAAAPSGRCAIPEHVCKRESGFRPDVVSANGLWHGKYQFTQGTWNHATVGAGHPEFVGVPPEQVPEEFQDAAAAWLWAQPRGCAHWGEC